MDTESQKSVGFSVGGCLFVLFFCFCPAVYSFPELEWLGISQAWNCLFLCLVLRPLVLIGRSPNLAGGGELAPTVSKKLRFKLLVSYVCNLHYNQNQGIGPCTHFHQATPPAANEPLSGPLNIFRIVTSILETYLLAIPCLKVPLQNPQSSHGISPNSCFFTMNRPGMYVC